MLKRIFDFLLSLFLLLIFSPLFVLVALAIMLTDGLPLFFIQKRAGKNGTFFRMYKFRTMSVRKEAADGSFDAGDVSRVTTIGRLLRKSKLDELPQLFNVLKGEMSFIGPRPEVEKWVQTYPERWSVVLSVKPGITDNASLEFRNEEEILMAAEDKEGTYRNEILPRKLDLYEDYVRNNSFFGDLLIIVRTFWAVLFK
ncbi:sugar transferase [Natronoflexus pectinivorans]|uniref:Lipopolysaccharide/colanic/teichoic acid biosynthesis glycosyltransferase n=1 Tax=Natronoflexus pectinivorans TaxID=682526 RepID=A0A4R2GF80_9BACT|nr:sugar transferase [Natronoflexus pectinivorans]TCO06868.1 lipopolysaccharide/colanic/teichoic acid biosynthesis glycosyltransferase [Natronoflexus pectinivorans]